MASIQFIVYIWSLRLNLPLLNPCYLSWPDFPLLASIIETG